MGSTPTTGTATTLWLQTQVSGLQGAMTLVGHQKPPLDKGGGFCYSTHMTARRMTNDQKEAAFATFGVREGLSAPVVYEDDDLFILGPDKHNMYALGERQEDGNWVYNVEVPGDHPMMKLALILATIAKLPVYDEFGQPVEDW